MQDKKPFLAGRYANFYLVSATPQETKYLVEPKEAEGKAFMEQMNGALTLMEQHRRLQQYEKEKFIPEVVNFDAETGRLTMLISANLTSAVPTIMIDYNNMVIDYRNATWLTKQAFQMASLAHEAGIILPFSAENFLVCYQSECFAMLDWSLAQVNNDKVHPIDAEVARAQSVDLATMLLGMVDYRGKVSNVKPSDSRLWEFMQEAEQGAFLSTAEAARVLNSILA